MSRWVTGYLSFKKAREKLPGEKSNLANRTQTGGLSVSQTKHKPAPQIGLEPKFEAIF
jgi:hypothetical protein